MTATRIVTRRNARLLAAALVLMLAGSATMPASGQRPALTMLDQLDHGKWEVRLRDGSQMVYPLCLDSGRRLIQLRHPQSLCDRVVIDDQANAVTVQYTCRGQGYGRTSIRRESNRLVQIQTQGIAEGLPFDFLAEARRTGDCPA